MTSSAITIGNFDGCHLGHQALIRKTLEQASKTTANISVAMSFYPHPDDFFNPTHKTAKLFTPEQKKKALHELGIENVEILNFNEDMRSLSAEEFYKKYLLDQFSATSISVGSSFKFGRSRGGNAKTLKHLCSKDGIKLNLLSEVQHNNGLVSSTKIRNLLAHDGNIEFASALLARPYLIQGSVSKGRQLGRTIGFPTANIQNCTQLVPLRGVYAGLADLRPRKEVNIFPKKTDLLPVMINIGYRPTFERVVKNTIIEAHIIDHSLEDNQLYGEDLSLYFIDRIRDEIKFSEVELLREQLQKDKAKTLNILKRRL